MTADEVKAALAKAAGRCWPGVKKASDLPFPGYWKAVTEWLTFHAPRVGDALMWKLIDGFAVSAKEAEGRGEAPTPPKVPESVREIWANVRLEEPHKQDGCQDGRSERRWKDRASQTDRTETPTSGGRPERRPFQGRLL